MTSNNQMINKELFEFSTEVADALAAPKPVVALESTVIAHGLPRPQNLETAFRLEAIVRGAGAVPATIAIIAGRLCVGLNESQLRHIAETDMKKVSTRDLPIALTRRWDGATTVASTIWIAHRAGIQVLATGGIGGIHRGSLPDVSADLPELARTPMVVVCSGAKIVLDLPATREWLETNGVTVVGYQCDELPAFYSPKSGLSVDGTVNSGQEVMELVQAQRGLALQSALLVTVPVPANAELPSELLKKTLDDALKQAETRRIGGRELTPFLLSRMARQSGGATLRANVALLENNARVGAEVALALAAT
ncbi:MAG: pseudouridine-5'-phosphate glycosidase [Pyrinomonadaceae bacterium]|nr:pseudouridine-5'-phosphate glycosidase [Pyrinomonadaceae bacterium]